MKRLSLVFAALQFVALPVGIRADVDEDASVPSGHAPAAAANADALFPSFADSHTAGLWLFDEPQHPNVTLTDASVAPGFTVTEALAAEGMVRQGDELWTYCSLREASHRSTAVRSRLVRYVNRLDGFTSLQANAEPGWLVTKPLTFEGNRLELNVAARGTARVGLLDEDGSEIPKLTVRDCDPIRADAIRRTVTWKGDADLARLSGRPVRLRIELQDADLYALRFAGGEAAR